MERFVTIMLGVAALLAIQGFDHGTALHGGGAGHPHDGSAEGEPGDASETRARPTNQVAVLTVWAEADKLAATAKFYEEVLGLRRVGSTADHHILDTDGTFFVIMQGQLAPPKEPARRWPLFALTVQDLDSSVEALRSAGVELPWGIEEFGAPEPSSRYVMFHDPAGNLIEIVQWL